MTESRGVGGTYGALMADFKTLRVPLTAGRMSSIVMVSRRRTIKTGHDSSFVPSGSSKKWKGEAVCKIASTPPRTLSKAPS